MNERTVAITRVLDAPRERVFKAWTQAQDLAHWWGPKGFTVSACETDASPGGVFRVCARSPEVIDVTFAEQGGRTEVTLHITAGGPTPEAAAMLEGMDKGWNQSVERLDTHLGPKH
jgi:uncharacterized protein YndB with AHSA1/START domain